MFLYSDILKERKLSFSSDSFSLTFWKAFWTHHSCFFVRHFNSLLMSINILYFEKKVPPVKTTEQICASCKSKEHSPKLRYTHKAHLFHCERALSKKQVFYGDARFSVLNSFMLRRVPELKKTRTCPILMFRKETPCITVRLYLTQLITKFFLKH